MGRQRNGCKFRCGYRYKCCQLTGEEKKKEKTQKCVLLYDIVSEAFIREPTATLTNAHSLSQMLLGLHPVSLVQLNGLGLWKTTSLG